MPRHFGIDPRHEHTSPDVPWLRAGPAMRKRSDALRFALSIGGIMLTFIVVVWLYSVASTIIDILWPL